MILVTEDARSDFRANLRAAVRGLHKGVLTLDQFYSSFGGELERGLSRAWYEGAAQCGIRPEELSPEERTALSRFILVQRMYMGGLGSAVDAGRGAGAKVGQFLSRVDAWANRYNEAVATASAMACADQKMVWRLGSTKVHCTSCAGFAGRVYRNSVWLANNALPQTRTLFCGGYLCGCSLQPTDDRVTPGPFPRRLLRY